MYKEFDTSWLEWIDLQKAQGKSASNIEKILIEAGFDPEDVEGRSGDKQSNPKTSVKPFVELPSSIFLTGARRVACDNAEVYIVDNFLTDSECVHLIGLIRGNLRLSTTTGDPDQSTGQRTSRTCDEGFLDDPLAKEIDMRICHFMGIPGEYAETMQGQWYDSGEQFKLHTDYFEPGTAEFEDNAAGWGQRSWTHMIYLNNVREGGDTEFPLIDKSFQPSRGSALIWNNLLPSGEPNPVVLHQGKPVVSGYKAIITKWFRDTGRDKKSRKISACHRALTQDGFIKSPMPAELFKVLREYYIANQHLSISESELDPNHQAKQHSAELIELTCELKDYAHQMLRPIVEAWVGDYLAPAFVSGIHKYLSGTSLNFNCDPNTAHVASVILNLDQDVDEDWPMYIEDHSCRPHEVILKPGEMVLYEGAKLQHGRPTPLIGRCLAKAFVHYELKE